jgi:pimeloyl-ACP methyl ester carboxylesterase
MPFTLTDDDCELYYERHGSGRAIAFVSGFMGITDIWEHQALSAKYQCIAHDNRGAGRSDKPMPRVAYGVARHARDLEAVLAAAGAERVVLVGHSMGGNIASLYALAHPDRVAGIVYVGSYVAGRQIVDAGNTLEGIKAAIRTKAGRVAFYAGVGLPDRIALESAKWPLYALLGNAESFMAFDLAPRIRELTMPCLVIHGDGDVVSPLDPCGTGLAAGLPDGALEVLAGVNHCPMTEQPERTTESIGRFVRDRVRW